MKQATLVDQQFGNQAAAYMASAVHASGADLEALKQTAQHYTKPKVLDLGCGAGHVSFAMAPFADSVIAYDLSQRMLGVVKATANDRSLHNIEIQSGTAEKLPFYSDSFDIVVTRFSAHHWEDVPTALAEIRRVLRPGGRAVVIDIVSSECPLHDTILQTAEILRDASHVRDYRVSEWSAMFKHATLKTITECHWRLQVVFGDWIARMSTPPERVIAIRSLFDSMADDARQYFQVQPDHSFSIEAAMFELEK